MVNRERLVKEFITMVQIDSPSLQERKFADYLKEKLQLMGLSVVEDQAGVGQLPTGNLIVKIPGSLTSVPTIMFSAHMDTVEPGCGIIPIVKDNVIYSEGCTILGSDDKAGIAPMLEAIQLIQELKIPHGNLEFVFTVGEEIGLLGAKAIDHKQLNAKYGFVLDCDGPAGTIINKAPTQYKLDIEIIGKSAHAGISPEKGINAIYIASKAIAQLKLGRIDHETTANIGVIEGGKATNIVPEKVNIEGEVRSLDPAKLEQYATEMVQIFETTAEENGAKAIIKKDLQYPRILLDKNDPVILLAAKAAENIGQKPNIVSTGGGSDANVFNGYGIPTLDLGIGMTSVHSVEEYVAIDDLVLTTRYVLEIIKMVSTGLY